MLIYEFRSDFAIEMEENWRKGRVQLGLKEGGGLWLLADGRWQVELPQWGLGKHFLLF